MLAHRRVLAGALPIAVACALLAAGAARAATVTIPTPCVTYLDASVPTLPIQGAGFTPGSTVNISTASAAQPTPALLTTVTADPAGNFVTSATPPLFDRFDTKQQQFFLVAQDPANPALAATTSFPQVRFGGSINPNRGRPSRKVTYTARGFPPGAVVYAHFRYHGKTKRNVRIATASSPCGIARKRMRLLPTRSHVGTWTIYIDDQPTYSPDTKLQLHTKLFIYRRYL